MRARRLSPALALLLTAAVAPRSFADGPDPALTAADKKYLDGLMAEFLFDPRGAERVAFKTSARTVWTWPDEIDAEGWLVPTADGRPARVYFTDGASIPAPPAKDVKKVDFKAACQARYAAVPRKPDGGGGPDADDAFRKMRQAAAGAVADHDLALAAWLYRLGDEPLAATALAAARKGKDDARERLRDNLAWAAFAGLVHAYMVRADAEALTHGERLLKLYPEQVKDGKEYHQAGRIVADLRRRQKAGTFGREPPAKWPDGFDGWDAAKKITYLVAALDEVDARQHGQPGGVDLASDRRVAALIRLGDAAVPALLDALEADDRLTRSVHFFRDFARSRTVLGVREAALTALMSILRVRAFDPVGTGDNFTARGEDTAKQTAKRLRAYWKEYGGLPFDERMMKVLTDPKVSFAARREAAGNLGSLTADRRLGTTVWTNQTVPGRRPNPAVAKFNKPTAAEAIVAVMDADLTAFDAAPSKDDVFFRDYKREHIVAAYLSALVGLGDGRIAPETAKRAAGAKTLRARRQWAQTAHDLGDPQPFRAFAEDVRAGKVELPAGGAGELEGVIRVLIDVGTPEADRALAALADPAHPLHGAVARQVLTRRPGGFDDRVWFSHPYCLPILRQALDDATPTGARYVIEKDRMLIKTKDGRSDRHVPEILADPAARRDEAGERVCDKAAETLVELVVGFELYHPLFKDADQRLRAMRAAFDRSAATYRPPTKIEARYLGVSVFDPVYVPEIKPLGRAATAADVAAGRAVFHLDGKGRPADLKLPAVATFKRDEKGEGVTGVWAIPAGRRPGGVVVVQAEVGPDGAVTYGVLSREGIRAIPAGELVRVKSIEQLVREEREAAEKKRKAENGGEKKD